MTDADSPLTPNNERGCQHSDDQSKDVQQDDVQNDAAIGSVLRTSLWVLIILGLPVIGLLAYLNIRKSATEPAQVEIEAPEGRKENDTTLPVTNMTNMPASAGIDSSHHAGK